MFHWLWISVLDTLNTERGYVLLLQVATNNVHNFLFHVSVYLKVLYLIILYIVSHSHWHFPPFLSSVQSNQCFPLSVSVGQVCLTHAYASNPTLTRFSIVHPKACIFLFSFTWHNFNIIWAGWFSRIPFDVHNIPMTFSLFLFLETFQPSALIKLTPKWFSLHHNTLLVLGIS